MDSRSPFDDPDVQAALRKAGVVHRPGLADEMLAELAPLLAEEGVDLDDPESIPDLDQLNAAMAYATERYNLELFTPVGESRSRALAALREISDAVHRDDRDRAERILGTVEPDATDRRPSAAQLIGTSLELLDALHSQDPTRAALARMSAPRWLGRSRAAGQDVLALARKGRARASLDRLMLNHGGQALAHGGALLVAVSLTALADQGPQDYAQVADRYLPVGQAPAEPRRSGQPSRPPSAPGSAFGPVAAAAVSSQHLVRGFRQWLQEDAETSADMVDAEVAAFESLVELVTSEGIDLHRPDELDTVLDIVDEYFPPHQVEAMYALLHDYVHFRLETEPSEAGWDEAHEVISEELLEDDGGASAALLAAVSEAEDLDDGQRRSAISDLPLMSATRALLEWIGSSRPITQTGVPRRADIETVAAMIGVDAEGTARRSERTDWNAMARQLGGPVSERQRVLVQSAQEIPELMAWWTGLQEAGVIELTVTRVRPGPHADSFAPGAELSLPVADELISTYVAEIAASPLFSASTMLDPFVRPIVTQTVARILGALVPDSKLEGPSGGLPELFQPRVREEMRRLEVAGLVEFIDDEPVVPLALRGPVMIGVMMASAVLEGEDE